MSNKKENNSDLKKIMYLVVGILVFFVVVIGVTFAYYTFAVSNNNSVNGEAGKVNLNLTVTKALPNNSGTDDILITPFSELANNLNAKCVSDEYATCQLYKITLKNNSTGVNTKVKGSVSFNNTTAPNLSWVYLDTYDSSKTYAASDLGTMNTASSEFVAFKSDELINSGNSRDFYLLVWVNESEEEQADEGSYSGIIKFEDSNGNGVTSTFIN